LLLVGSSRSDLPVIVGKVLHVHLSAGNRVGRTVFHLDQEMRFAVKDEADIRVACTRYLDTHDRSSAALLGWEQRESVLLPIKERNQTGDVIRVGLLLHLAGLGWIVLCRVAIFLTPGAIAAEYLDNGVSHAGQVEVPGNVVAIGPANVLLHEEA